MRIYKIKGKDYIFTEMPKITDIVVNENDARLDSNQEPILAFSEKTKSTGNTHFATPVQWWQISDSLIKIQASGEMHDNARSGGREEVSIFVDNTEEIRNLLQNGKIYNIRCDFTDQKKEDGQGRLYYPRFDLLDSKQKNKHQLLDYLYGVRCFRCKLKEEPNIRTSNVSFDFTAKNVLSPVKYELESNTLKGKSTEVMFTYSRDSNIGISSIGGVPVFIYKLEEFLSYDDLREAAAKDAKRIYETLSTTLKGEVLYREKLA
jgi:hypothetical protein